MQSDELKRITKMKSIIKVMTGNAQHLQAQNPTPANIATYMIHDGTRTSCHSTNTSGMDAGRHSVSERSRCSRATGLYRVLNTSTIQSEPIGVEPTGFFNGSPQTQQASFAPMPNLVQTPSGYPVSQANSLSQELSELTTATQQNQPAMSAQNYPTNSQASITGTNLSPLAGYTSQLSLNPLNNKVESKILNPFPFNLGNMAIGADQDLNDAILGGGNLVNAASPVALTPQQISYIKNLSAVAPSILKAIHRFRWLRSRSRLEALLFHTLGCGWNTPPFFGTSFSSVGFLLAFAIQ